MTAPHQPPMAFYHEEGIVPSWNAAMQYAADGHVATMPEIIAARLATNPGDAAWETSCLTTSAEYYGVGADGRKKLIIAHGVGPMSTLEGITRAYSWQYEDNSGHRHGGRISAEEFLKLESGHYAAPQIFDWSTLPSSNVQVVDMEAYSQSQNDAFYRWESLATAHFDRLLWARLGPQTSDYLSMHGEHALSWHGYHSIKLPTDRSPMIIYNTGALNSPYDTSPHANGRRAWPRRIPRPLEPGMAMGHLLGIGRLVDMYSGGLRGLTTVLSCHEWPDGACFVGVPAGATWQGGITQSLQPSALLRQQ